MSEANDRMDSELYLVMRATNPEMVLAWMQYFSDPGPWSIGSGDLLREKGDAALSPANSYGHMDGGIDLAYRSLFGLGIQNRVQKVIGERFDGLLPVGKAIIVPTNHDRIPHLVVAPTMERPKNVADTDNARRAMRAALVEILRYNDYQRSKGDDLLHRVLVPGLCTGVGRMDPFDSARQMRQAVDEVRS